jgi:methionine synthase II (cobalamin-independent)
MQESIGLDVVTDGEFRRFSFLDQVVSEIDGVEPIEGAPVRLQQGQGDEADQGHLPFAAAVLSAWSPELSTAAYRDAFELFADAAAIIKAECGALAALGCTYIQIDSPDTSCRARPRPWSR